MNSLNLPVYRRKLAQKSPVKTVCYAKPKTTANLGFIAGTPRFGPAGYCQNRTPSPSWRPVLTPDRSPFLRKGGGISPGQEATWNKTHRGEKQCDLLNLRWRLSPRQRCLRAVWAMMLNAPLSALLLAALDRRLSAAAWPLVRLSAQLAVPLPTTLSVRCASARNTTTHKTRKAAGALLCAAFLHALRPARRFERTC